MGAIIRAISEEEIQGVFLQALDKIAGCKNEYVSNMRSLLKTVSDTKMLERENEKTQADLEKLSQAAEGASMSENAAEYEAITSKQRLLNKKLKELEADIRK